MADKVLDPKNKPPGFPFLTSCQLYDLEDVIYFSFLICKMKRIALKPIAVVKMKLTHAKDLEKGLTWRECSVTAITFDYNWLLFLRNLVPLWFITPSFSHR